MLGEKGKEDLRPTDTDYPDETIPLSKPSVFEWQKRSARPSFGFESFAEPDSLKSTQRCSDFDFFNKRTSSFLDQRQDKPSSEGWIDCHNSFMSYLGKLNKLVGN